MTNIYNKKIITNKGTLVGNWYEEEVLRTKTGEGRTLPGRHIPKRTMNFDHEIKNTNQIDNTKQRILGEEIKVPNETTYQTYGQFPTAQDKYKKTGIKEKIFEDFFKCYVNDSQNDKSQLEQSIQNIRLYDTTNRNKLITQPVDYSSLGRRHMVTQDNIPVNPTTVDKLFMASHDMGKFPSIIHENIAKEYVDSYVPYYKDKEVTFWSMNLEKGNMYKSAANGINAFAKSSGFTQPIHLTKSVSQFEGNVNMTNTNAKNVHLNESDVKFSEEYKSFKTRQQEVVDLIPDIRNKIFTACLKRGSLGLRHLKIFLLNLSKRLYDRIDKSNFKYFLINYGIALNDKEIDFIYQRFDTKRNSEINFNEFLDSIRYVNEERLNHMKNFYDQLTLEDFVSFKKLEGNLRPDLHPEVAAYKKSSNELRHEYLTTWIKKDDMVPRENFIGYLTDVSSCVESDEEYLEILKSFGYTL